jgi:hypothetical protein
MQRAGSAVSMPLNGHVEEILYGVPPDGFDALHVVFSMLEQLGDFIKMTIIHLLREGYEKALNVPLNQQRLCFRDQ